MIKLNFSIIVNFLCTNRVEQVKIYAEDHNVESVLLSTISLANEEELHPSSVTKTLQVALCRFCIFSLIPTHILIVKQSCAFYTPEMRNLFAL